MRITRHIARLTLAAAVIVCGIGSASAEVLWMDNFDVADTSDFDGASTVGRLSGTLASDIVLKSAKVVQTISSNQLGMVANKPELKSGRVKFVESSDGTTRFDWMAGDTGAAILAAGGLRIEFDWTTSDTNSTDWIAFSIGITNHVPEPDRLVLNPHTDFGILFRGEGNDQIFTNGVVVADDGNFGPDGGQRHVVLDFAFTSFDEGEPVDVEVTVGGNRAEVTTFHWAENNGELYMELGSYLTGELIDNYSVSTRSPLLFMDNFDVADTNNFDDASLEGRRSGRLATTTLLQTHRKTNSIAGNQLSMVGHASPTNDYTSGRVGFHRHNLAGFDWAWGMTGDSILDAGGLRVEFDWTATTNLTADWISFSIGHTPYSEPEPDRRVIHGETDYGILFKEYGGVQQWTNGSSTTFVTNAFPSTTNQQHVVIDIAFNSFTNDAPAFAVANVGGTVVGGQMFNWDNNDGELYLELGSYITGTLFDNYSVSLRPASVGSTILDWSKVSGDIMKMEVVTGNLASNYPVASVDLAGGGWSRVAHSDDPGNPFDITNFTYSATDDGLSRVIYVNATNAVGFFGISNE